MSNAKADEIDNEDPLQGAIFTALGKVSALFMSNPQSGTAQVMPTEKMVRVGNELYDEFYAHSHQAQRELLDRLEEKHMSYVTELAWKQSVFEKAVPLSAIDDERKLLEKGKRHETHLPL